MAEKKEKQWAVVKQHLAHSYVDKVVWFDARKAAREYASKANAKSRTFCYFVLPMTRGPGA